jgi:nucleoside-diphosphate-sugar epimerase
MTEIAHHRPTLVLGGSGKTGRRVVQRLTRRDSPVRIGSRSSEATGRDIAYIRIPPEDFAADLAAGGVRRDIIDFLVDLFGTVLDGGNAGATDGVERVLGRRARDFVDYARVTAATGVWTPTIRPSFSEGVR